MTETAKKPKPIRCDPRWRAADPALGAAVARLADLLEAQEHSRARRRRSGDAATFRLAVEAIACNLLALSTAAPDRPLAIPLANAASQATPIFGKVARKVIDLMLKLGLVIKTRGYPYVGPSTIEPTPEMRKHLPLGTIAWGALRLDDDPQVVVVLRKATRDDDDDDDAKPAPPRRLTRHQRQWLRKVTAEMHAINAAIRGAPVECDASAAFHVDERPRKPPASLVTAQHRSLRRYFNGTWEQGGRLFGGFWQTMGRTDRFRHIRIGDEPVALVDYGQLFLRLAYAKAGVKPPPGDLYDVTGSDACGAEWKRLREARKKLVNALFFRTALLTQWPGARPDERFEMRDAFPPGTTPRAAIKAIKQKHAPIADWFERGHGLHFMRTEGDLIVAVTMALFAQGIAALPIHDAVLVPERHAATAKAVMERAARRLTGAAIPAAIETAADHQ